MDVIWTCGKPHDTNSPIGVLSLALPAGVESGTKKNDKTEITRLENIDEDLLSKDYGDSTST